MQTILGPTVSVSIPHAMRKSDVPDPLILMVYILASAVGMAYFIYGKRQQNAAFLGAGVFLCIYPYFFSSIAALILISLVLLGAPFLLTRR